jgi:hypothetical protein
MNDGNLESNRFNPVCVYTVEERDMWQSINPAVPVKIIPKPEQSLNPVFVSSPEEAEYWTQAHPEVPVKISPESYLLENTVNLEANEITQY